MNSLVRIFILGILVVLTACASGQPEITAPSRTLEPTLPTREVQIPTLKPSPVDTETPLAVLEAADLLDRLLSDDQEGKDNALQQIIDTKDELIKEIKQCFSHE